MSDSPSRPGPRKRSFGAGSRETPDIYDKFLERAGYYRKHTAADATCLFRAVSEQRYDIQMYHERVRGECIRFMRNNKPLFVKDIKWNFDAYTNNMSKTRTYGSLLELKAMALYHKANVILFQPFTEGKWFMNDPSHKDTWRLFVGHENHFDSVFTLEYMAMAAQCQAIVYEVLYKSVFRLPDVEYAVERMLHDIDDTRITYGEDEDGRAIAHTEDGRQLALSTVDGTDCVLMHSHLCHFHNQENFPTIQRFFSIFGTDEGCRVYIGSHFRDGATKPNPLLPDANVSCVRQLLKMGITPFPYKTAKSLDRNIYRNVEFDVWMESRVDKRHEPVYENGLKGGPKVTGDGNCRAGHIDKKAVFVSAKDRDELRLIDTVRYFKPYGLTNKMYRNNERVRWDSTDEKEQPPNDGRTHTVSDPFECAEPVSGFEQRPNVPITSGVIHYPVPPIYIPSPEPYAINTVGILPPDANGQPHALGVPGCFYSPYAGPLHFYATTQHHQQAPIQLPGAPLPVSEQSAVLEQQQQQQLAVIGRNPTAPIPLSNVPGEYVMFVDGMQQPQQQPLGPYAPYAGHTPYVHGCFYRYLPNGGETNTAAPLLAYDNPYPAAVVRSPPYWPF